MPDFDFKDLEDELAGMSPAPDESLNSGQLPADPLAITPEVLAARESRDQDVGLANLAQGVSGIGASLASQGRVHADPAVFDAVRKDAETKAKEATTDAASQRKLVSDFIKAKAAAKNQAGAEEWRQKNFEQRERGIEATKDQRDRTYNAENHDLDRLPGEDRETVKDLARKNAGKVSIANQIDAVLGNWDTLPEDQKLLQGRQLIKVLNSTEGADAVGAEEAKRLGSKLEFAFGNLTNSNTTQFGRDLKGFKEQAANTSKAIRGAVGMNQKIISDAYAKAGIRKPVGDSPLSEAEKKRLEELRAKRGQ